MNQAAPVPNPRPWLTLAVVGAAFFMTVLDVAIVNVAIPSIQRDLNIREETVQWVITAYAITFGGFLLLGGRMADLLGRRRIFVGGLILFTLASLVCGLANDAGVLIAARAVQGVGAAIISPAALSIVTTTFTEGAERNKALGIWGALGGSGAAAVTATAPPRTACRSLTAGEDRLSPGRAKVAGIAPSASSLAHHDPDPEETACPTP